MTTVQFKHNYENYYEAMFNFARKLTRDINEADELVQITAIKAFKSLHTFRVGASFKNWVFTILKNTFITKYNKRRRRNTLSTPVEEMAFALDRKQTAKNGAMSNLIIHEIKQSMDELSEKSKTPFELHIKGYQYNEIADELDIPIGTVKSRINYARKKLRSILNKKEILPK